MADTMQDGAAPTGAPSVDGIVMAGRKAQPVKALAVVRFAGSAASGTAGRRVVARDGAAAMIDRSAVSVSVAPVGKGGRKGSFAQALVAKAAAGARDGEARPAARPMVRDVAAADDRWLDRTLSDFFDRQSRLPPSGATGFDPRLSPAWPGLKLPA